jgi:CRP-like cAMP-binding protein
VRKPSPSDLRALRRLDAGLVRLGWPAAEVARLLAAAQLVELPRRHVLYRAGSPATRVWWVLDGVAKVLVPGAHGRRVLVGLAKPGAVLGSHLAVGGRRIDAAEALTPMRVAEVSLPAFKEITAALPTEVVLGMMRGTLDHLSRTFRRTLRLLTLDLRGKVALALLDLADGFGVPDADGRLLPVDVTHGDLAELTGVSRARVTKVLAELDRHGVIVRRGRHLVVDVGALRPLAAE